MFPLLLDHFVGICASKHAIAACCEDTSSVVFRILMQFVSSFFYPDATAGLLRRSMALRMSRNNSRGTATSAIWKITCRE